MTTIYLQLAIDAFLHGIVIDLHASGQVALANLWIVVVLGVVVALGINGRPAQRRRRY